MNISFRPSGSKRTIPLKRDQVQYIVDEFSDRKDWRMVILTLLLYKCVRVGDTLLTLRICDIYEPTGELRDCLRYVEQKTGKTRVISLKGNTFENALRLYWSEIRNKDYYGPLFYSKKLAKPLTASGVKKLLQQFVGKRGIQQCSCHSMRKSGSRHMWEAGVRIETISNVLNHHSSRVTELYISVTPQDISQAMRVLEI